MNIHPFYGGPFSQWAISYFTLSNVKFNCAEQAMMAIKALTFGDIATHRKIMQSSHPAEQKAFGRKVSNYSDKRWHKVAREVVMAINVAKFSQNTELLNYMISTKELELVEASPTDKIWGVGLRVTDPDVLIKENWKGTNWLGEAIMAARGVILDPTQYNVEVYYNNLKLIEGIIYG